MCSRRRRDLLKLAGVIVLPMALIAKEPDLGTTLTYLPILAIGVFLAGMPWKYWLAIGLVAAVVAPIGFVSLQGYQKNRIVSFLDPERDPQGTGYQTDSIQDRSGHPGGTWVTSPREARRSCASIRGAAHGFIFSAFAEEHGFIGVMLVLILYFVLLMQIVPSSRLHRTEQECISLYGCQERCCYFIYW